MQFPVPQFTDVEDRIIGPLTIKQFGIVFGAGAMVFLGYSATKSLLVLIFLGLLFGVPALALAFAKINGRPLYNTIGFFFKFFTSEKLLIFHKQGNGEIAVTQDKREAEKKDARQKAAVKTKQMTMDEVQKLLAQTAARQKEIIDKSRL